MSSSLPGQPDYNVTMASVPTLAHVDYYNQVLDNACFLNSKRARISIIVACDKEKGFKVVVLKEEDSKREAIFEAVGRTYADAMKGLWQTCCEAVGVFIKANGYNRVPDPREARWTHVKNEDDSASDSSDLSDSSVLSFSDEDEDTDSDLASDGASAASRDKQGKRHSKKEKSRKSSRRHTKSTAGTKGSGGKRSRSRSASGCPKFMRPPQRPGMLFPGPLVRDVVFPGRPGVRPVVPSPAQGLNASRAPVPPPRILPRTNATIFTSPNPTIIPHAPQSLHPIRPAPSGGPGGSVAQDVYHDVRLHICWKGHGEQLVLDQCYPNMRGIKLAAVAWVRNHASSFTNVTEADLGRLSVLVRQATIDGDTYNMSSYVGDDLRKLMRAAGASSIPRFEVDIETPITPAPGGVQLMALRPSDVGAPNNVVPNSIPPASSPSSVSVSEPC